MAICKLAEIENRGKPASSNIAPLPSQEERIALWRPVLIGEWLAKNVNAPRWLIDKFIPADQNILLSGKAKKAYKTWLAYAVAVCIASGRQLSSLVPTNPEGEGVIVLEAEGGCAPTKDRWQWISAGAHPAININEIKKLYFSHRDGILLDDPRWVGRVRTMILDLKAKLLIVDPFAMFNTGDENSVADVAKVMASFNVFREAGAGVLFVHHLTKTDREFTGKDVDEEIRGSSAISGFYDMHLALRQRRLKQDYNELIIRSKDDEERYATVKWEISKEHGLAKLQFDIKESAEGLLEPMALALLDMLLPTSTYSSVRIEEMLHIDKYTRAELIEYMLKHEMLERGKKGFHIASSEE